MNFNINNTFDASLQSLVMFAISNFFSTVLLWGFIGLCSAIFLIFVLYKLRFFNRPFLLWSILNYCYILALPILLTIAGVVYGAIKGADDVSQKLINTIAIEDNKLSAYMLDYATEITELEAWKNKENWVEDLTLKYKIENIQIDSVASWGLRYINQSITNNVAEKFYDLVAPTVIKTMEAGGLKYESSEVKRPTRIERSTFQTFVQPLNNLIKSTIITNEKIFVVSLYTSLFAKIFLIFLVIFLDMLIAYVLLKLG